MHPEDRVLVGVINRKRDFLQASENGWYRIPGQRMPDGLNTEYLAFFLSGSPFKEQSGGIHYYARMTGVELRYRYELLPEEVDHPRANNIYYRVAIGQLQSKSPPIINPEKRSISFIYTTWDRFVEARVISDLYSEEDKFVDRMYTRLRSRGIVTERLWKAQQGHDEHAPGLRVRCQEGDFYLSTQGPEDDIHIGEEDEPVDLIFESIKRRIEEMGGLIMLNYPQD